MERLVLAISADHADSLLDGSRDADHRKLPPARLPAKAYLAVVGTGSVVGECVLAERADVVGPALPAEVKLAGPR